MLNEATEMSSPARKVTPNSITTKDTLTVYNKLVGEVRGEIAQSSGRNRFP